MDFLICTLVASIYDPIHYFYIENPIFRIQK